MPVSEADKLFLCCRKFLVAIRAKEFLYQIMITFVLPLLDTYPFAPSF